MKCTSCNTTLVSEDRFVEFGCPECAETKIVRCERCKRLKNKYICKKCKFRGP